jgi:CDP-4-dehydro-6-deoxyglucose reductase, E3
MKAVHYEGRSYPVAPGCTVLDALQQGGVDAAHSCKAGICGSCMMRATDGDLPEKAQSGLKDSWKAQGYFLPCVCLPVSDLSITRVDADARCGAVIAALEPLSSDVLRVRLALDTPLSFRAGQYITVFLAGNLARSYSIASLPAYPSQGAEIDIHVRRIAGGKMSGWLHDSAKPGDRVEILGPSGSCFYVPGKPEQPLVLAGTGTGLAPLYGILMDALEQGHTGPIHLFHGALHERGLYLVDELRRLAGIHSNVEYTPTVLNAGDGGSLAVGPIDHVVMKRFPKLNGWRAFVCGDPAIVNVLKKKIFLAGAASHEIHADAFLPSAMAQ